MTRSTRKNNGLGGLTPKQQEALGKIRSIILFHKNIIANGTLVAIDPSCISATGSKPAYAIYQKGEFIEQGILDIKYKPSLPYRLQMIRKTIAESIAPYVDICILEETPVIPIRSRKDANAAGKAFMNARSISSLKKACGAIIGAFNPGTPVIEMPAHLWQKICYNHGVTISKEDDEDARLIGWATIKLLSSMVEAEGALYDQGEDTTEKDDQKR